jgi:hypothetical protein
MWTFDDGQTHKILEHLLLRIDGMKDLYDYILGHGFEMSSAQGLEYMFIHTFRHPDKAMLVIFIRTTESVRADQGHFSVVLMDPDVGRNEKYYGHTPAEMLEQIKGKL